MSNSHGPLISRSKSDSRAVPNEAVSTPTTQAVAVATLGAKKACKACNCKKSSCLKSYCECFAEGVYCDSCNCVGCQNNPQHEKIRADAIEATLERNPTAFKPKITSSPNAVLVNQREVPSEPEQDHSHDDSECHESFERKDSEIVPNAKETGDRALTFQVGKLQGHLNLLTQIMFRALGKDESICRELGGIEATYRDQSKALDRFQSELDELKDKIANLESRLFERCETWTTMYTASEERLQRETDLVRAELSSVKSEVVESRHWVRDSIGDFLGVVFPFSDSRGVTGLMSAATSSLSSVMKAIGSEKLVVQLPMAAGHYWLPKAMQRAIPQLRTAKLLIPRTVVFFWTVLGIYIDIVAILGVYRSFVSARDTVRDELNEAREGFRRKVRNLVFLLLFSSTGAALWWFWGRRKAATIRSQQER